MEFSNKISIPWYLERVWEKFLERPPINLCSPNTKSIFRIKFRFLGPLKNSGKNSSNDLLSTYVLLIQSRTFCQNFYSLAHLKFWEKFLERPPIDLYSPNTKWNFRSKFRFLDPFPNSGKNFSGDLLPTYVLLIQSRNFSHIFDKVLRKISRATSYQLMFS